MVERIIFDVYRRGGRYFATAGMNGPGVDWIVLPDVIPVDATVESIAAAFRQLAPAIRKAVAEAAKVGRRYVDEIDEKHWERMGAKSYRQFMRSTSACDVVMRSDQIKVWYMIHDTDVNEFASIDEGPNTELPPDASYEEMARAVLEIFAKYPPLPGDEPPAPKRRPRKTASTER